jgi:diadenosine tetraphosphate (Ap4A) HIT family hydrolase
MSCPLCNPKGENVIIQNNLFRVVLVDEIPAFIRVILNKHIAEFSGLDFDEYQQITKIIYQIEKLIIEIINPDKINIASLGNYVPHLHIHIIPRWEKDSWFPDSIWSEKQREYKYQVTENQIKNLIERIKKLDI